MAEVMLEVCVDSAAGLAAALQGGAGRIELCAALELGGLSPSPGLMRLAAGAPVPVYAMIRPRPGDFVFSADDLAVMQGDIAAVRRAGLAGVVLGASLASGALDAAMLARLVALSAGLGMTLHRAFELVPDRAAALELAIELGFERILTSGGAAAAPQGVAALRLDFQQAAGRIGIMPGAGVTAASVGALRGLPLREVHASCSGAVARADRFQLGGARETSVALVRDLVAVLKEW